MTSGYDAAGRGRWGTDISDWSATPYAPHGIYLDISTPGEHEIQFSMREDGFEFDKFLRDFEGLSRSRDPW